MTESRIIIGKPSIQKSPRGCRLACKVDFGDITESIWFEVEDEFCIYLTDDRSDAFVIPCLYRAMTQNKDIYCEAPVSRRLLHQINEQLARGLARSMEKFHEIHVYAEPTDEPLPSGKAVATGWTGGVDCSYTLMQMLGAEEPSFQLTHLLIANNGALESENDEALLEHLVNRAKNNIGSDTGLKIVGVNSNLRNVFNDENYLAAAGYRLVPCVLALQKLFSVFYHSGAYEYTRFAFVPENSAYYELFLMINFSTQNTTFYSSGSSVSRIQKLKELSNYSYAQKYLHPCIYTKGSNCGKCSKCIRTQAALYALGTLDRFNEVFDLKAFEDNKDRIIADVIIHRMSQHYGEPYALLKAKGMISKRAIQIAAAREAAIRVAERNRIKLRELLERSTK